MAGILRSADMTHATMTAADSSNAATANGAQYLTFVCGGEESTPCQFSPAYVLGVMNLRGMIVPVVDLRRRLNLEQRNFDASTVVIVVRVQSSRGEKTVGI